MKYLGNHEYELTPEEGAAHFTYNHWLDLGYNVQQAVNAAKDEHAAFIPDAEFWNWLVND